MPNKILKCKSRELRGSQLYTHCDCKRRNGLQHDCQRRDCFLSDQKSCSIRPFPKCCTSLYANRFENISMGKQSYPEGQPIIRVFDSGKCVNQYDPRGEKVPINPPNQCGPKYDCKNKSQTQKSVQTDIDQVGIDRADNDQVGINRAEIDQRSIFNQQTMAGLHEHTDEHYHIHHGRCVY